MFKQFLQMRRILILCFMVTVLVSCSGSKYEKTSTGIVVHPSGKADAKIIRLDVVNSDIIHVRTTNKDGLSDRKSIVVTDSVKPNTEWTVDEKDGSVVLSTPIVSVSVKLETGEIAFKSPDGNCKLVEKTGGGKSFSQNPRVADLVQVRQEFESPADEALYGLGQHQNMQMNYKGQDVDLSQYNLVVAIPFLVSNKNYGLLWDNYSRTKFGDPRDYQPLSTLKLYNDKGDEGGLSANYYLLNNQSTPVLSRNEKVIQYENLDELANVPKEFTLANGIVKWSGQIESSITGKHKFLLFSSGYLKLWVDDVMLIDSWRQGWNPWTNRLLIDMVAGQKKSIRIEWTPDSGQAYVSLNTLTPADETEQNRISLFSEGAREIDYYYINGNSTDDVIKGYRQLTGKAPIMPKWALGFWQSRERYKTQDQLLDVVKEFRRRNIPLDNIVMDWMYWKQDSWGQHAFDTTRFQNATQMISDLHNKYNTHFMISVWAKYNKGTKNYKIMDENGWLYKRNIEMNRLDWVGPGYESTFYDAFSEPARNEFWRQINNELFSKGVDAWWLDATEPDIHSNLPWDEKKKCMDPTALGSAEEYFNPYSLMQCKGVYENQRKTSPNQRVFILTRSAFAGQQRYASATWSGDVASRWFDFKAQIPAGLNFSVSGIPYWTTDIGGFAVEKRYESQDPAHLDEWRELNTRWYQYGAFCPLFRSHGQLPFREIFNIAPETSEFYQSMLYFDKLRYKLMPYTYSLAGITYFDDYTIMRPLMMDFASDSKTLNITDQYMFGPSILVAPVTDYKARSRQVYLPSGKGWYDFYTDTYYNGGQTINADAPIMKMPLFVAEGSIVPVGPEIQYAAQPYSVPLTLVVYTGANGQFKLYEDEGTTYDYENGKYTAIILDYNQEKHTLTIGDRVCSYDGMKAEREFNVVWKSKEGKTQKSEVVKYNGNMILVTCAK
jgi:alpha-D-xyloside xylohydrolase